MNQPQHNELTGNQAIAQVEHAIDMEELATEPEPLVVPADIHDLPKAGEEALVADIIDGPRLVTHQRAQTLPDPERTRDEHRIASRFSPRTERAIEEQLWAIFRVFDGLDEQGRQAAIKAYFMAYRDRGRDHGQFGERYLNDD